MLEQLRAVIREFRLLGADGQRHLMGVSLIWGSVAITLALLVFMWG